MITYKKLWIKLLREKIKRLFGQSKKHEFIIDHLGIKVRNVSSIVQLSVFVIWTTVEVLARKFSWELGFEIES